MKPLLGISLMHEPEFLQATVPLFLNNQVEVVEWSFDTFRYHKDKPLWLAQLLKEYSQNSRLIGHGVRYSVFDAKFTKRQTAWLNQLKREVKKYNYNHITEHFGFMSNSNFHEGAPLPVPLNKQTLAIGTDRLKRIQDAALLPVGIENLAFSFCMDDVKKQGHFLNQLITPLNGFLILDLHNLFCQAKNFKIDLLEIVKLYPLNKVREIHISGGSWENSVYAKDLKKVRRDTHDEKVPAEIFDVLPAVLKLCRNTQYIIFERLGNTLSKEKDQVQFRKDFLKIKSVIDKIHFHKTPLQFQKLPKALSTKPLTDLNLYKQQQLILSIIRSNTNPYQALNDLQIPELKDWQTQNWKPSMVETAIQLIKKWG